MCSGAPPNMAASSSMPINEPNLIKRTQSKRTLVPLDCCGLFVGFVVYALKGATYAWSLCFLFCIFLAWVLSRTKSIQLSHALLPAKMKPIYWLELDSGESIRKHDYKGADDMFVVNVSHVLICLICIITRVPTSYVKKISNHCQNLLIFQ